MKLRLFFALDLDQSVRAKITNQIEMLKTETAFRWIRSENLHLTIRFLGSVEEIEIEKIKQALQGPIVSFPRFECSLHTLGGFPSVNACRIIWFGVSKGSRQCIELKNIIDSAILPLKFSKDEDEFIPHLTIARSKTKLHDISDLETLASTFEEIPCGTFSFLTLFSSDLALVNPVYKPIFKLHFK